MQSIALGWLDYSILLIYVAFVVGIGFALKRYMKTSSDFLTSSRGIPTWVTGLAFLSANLGAVELVGTEPLFEEGASSKTLVLKDTPEGWKFSVKYVPPIVRERNNRQ